MSSYWRINALYDWKDSEVSTYNYINVSENIIDRKKKAIFDVYYWVLMTNINKENAYSYKLTHDISNETMHFINRNGNCIQYSAITSEKPISYFKKRTFTVNNNYIYVDYHNNNNNLYEPTPNNNQTK